MFETTIIPPEDAQFLASREFQVAEIARIYRVPHVLIGSMEKTTSWGTGIEQLMIGFSRHPGRYSHGLRNGNRR